MERDRTASLWMPRRVVIWKSPRTCGWCGKYAGFCARLHRHADGSRMLKRWLHMPVRDTRVLLDASKLLAHCRISPPGYSRYCAGRRPGTYSGTSGFTNCSPTDLARMRHAFQQLPELRAQLELSIVHRYRRYVRRWASLPSSRSAGASNHRHTAGAGTRRWVIASGYNEELDEWRALADGAPIIWSVWKSASVNVPAWTR